MSGPSTWHGVVDYLLGFSGLYPSIEAWSSKVRLGVRSGSRGVHAVIGGDGAIHGLAIVKNSAYAKLSHISVAPGVRDGGLGLQLIRVAVADMLRLGARQVHVTTGEEVTEQYGEFFIRCGFSRRSFRNNRYRRGAAEWEWTASPEILRRRLLIHSGEVTTCDTLSHSGSARVPLVRLHPAFGHFEWRPLAGDDLRHRAGQPHERKLVQSGRQFCFEG
jgi:hypothetical protein